MAGYRRADFHHGFDANLADEPTGSLDASNRDRIVQLLQAINATGKTIVIATHTPELVAVCHRSIALP